MLPTTKLHRVIFSFRITFEPRLRFFSQEGEGEEKGKGEGKRQGLLTHPHCSSLQRSPPCTDTDQAPYSSHQIYLGKQQTWERRELETLSAHPLVVLTAADGNLGALSAVGEGVRIALQTDPVSSGGITGEVSCCVVYLHAVH